MAEFEFGGVTFKGGKMFAILTALSTLGGGLWGGFEFYKDYMDMKEIIQNIDTDEISARNDLIETKLEDAIDYTRDIKNGLREDIIKLEGQIDRMEDKVDTSEERVKSTQQSIETTLEGVRAEINQVEKDVIASIREVEAINRDTEKDVRDTMRTTEDRIQEEMRKLDDDIRETLQEALDNPLTRK
jgi:hypothetical protein